jgi:hypothetical protein
MLKKNLQQALRESVVDPKHDTAFRFVVELNNSNYCVTRAQELLANLVSVKMSSKVADTTIKQAITLLAMARVINGSGNTKQTDLPIQPKDGISSSL